jgi:hypothetical protein
MPVAEQQEIAVSILRRIWRFYKSLLGPETKDEAADRQTYGGP